MPDRPRLVGVRLLDRTSRSVSPTAAGAADAADLDDGIAPADGTGAPSPR